MEERNLRKTGKNMARRLMSWFIVMTMFLSSFDGMVIPVRAAQGTEDILSDNTEGMDLPDGQDEISSESLTEDNVPILEEDLSGALDHQDVISPAEPGDIDESGSKPSYPETDVLSLSENTADTDKAFDMKEVIGEVTVRVSADPGVFPEGAYMEATPLYGGELDKIEEAVHEANSEEMSDERRDNAPVLGDDTVYVFDIVVYDKEGHEIQPDTDKGEVRVSISADGLGEATEQKMFCVEENGDVTFLDTEVNDDTASVQAEHFTPYGAILSSPLLGSSGPFSIANKTSDRLTAEQLAGIVMETNVEGTVKGTSRDGTVYTFTNGSDAIGLESGIVLDTSGAVGGSKDSELNSIKDGNYSYGGHTSVFTLDLVADGDLLNFNYVFASGEFNQLPRYNDPFGLFVKRGEGPWVNIAKITRSDGTKVPVNINNLRAGLSGTEMNNGQSTNLSGSHSLFTQKNVGGGVYTNGVSQVFNAQAAVTKGETVHVKFVIADISDTAVDSYVFIEKGSLNFEGPKKKVEYYADGIQVGETEKIVQGESAVIRAAKVKDGYAFLGWNTKADGSGTMYQPGQLMPVMDHVTLTARYAPIKSTVRVQVDLDDEGWNGRRVELIGKDFQGINRVYTLPAESGTPGAYIARDILNSGNAYDIYVDGKKTDKTVTVKAIYDALSLSETVKYVNLNVTTRLDEEASGRPGTVSLLQGTRKIMDMTGSDGIYQDQVLKSSGTYRIYVDNTNTGVTVSTEDNTRVIDYTLFQVKLKDTELWTDAAVNLLDSGRNLAVALAYNEAGSSGNTSVYEYIVPRNDQQFTLYVGTVNTGKQLKALKDESKAELEFYTATLTVNCSSIPDSFVASMTNGREKFNYTRGSTSGDTTAFTAKHVFNSESRPDYDVSIAGVSTVGTPIVINKENSNRSITVRVVTCYKYEASSTVVADPTYHPVEAFTRYVISGGKVSDPGEGYLAGYTFDGWSTQEWSRGETGGYTKYSFNTTAVNTDLDLYAHYLSPRVTINEIVRTDGDGAINGSGTSYRMANLSIEGFEPGNTIKYVIFEHTNVNTITALLGLPEGTDTTDLAGKGILKFDTPVSMAAAQAVVRDKIVITPKDGNDSTIKVTVMDQNGHPASDEGEQGLTTASDSGLVELPADGSTLSDGTVYVVKSDRAVEGNTERAGLTVPESSTVYIFVPKGVTLTIKGSDGGNANGQTGGMGGKPGILLPSTSKLYLLGSGSVNITGGKGGNGANGGNARTGEANNIVINIPDDDADGTKSYYSCNTAYGGTGGIGGGGGAGGGAGIGLAGGAGGNGGNGGNHGSISISNVKIGTGAVRYQNGARGTVGNNGINGDTGGGVYVVGSLQLFTNNGGQGDKGKKGSFSNGGNKTGFETIWMSTSAMAAVYYGGGGAGGGGGYGCGAYAIGGGGAGGNGGSGGGGGGVAADSCVIPLSADFSDYRFCKGENGNLGNDGDQTSGGAGGKGGNAVVQLGYKDEYAAYYTEGGLTNSSGGAGGSANTEARTSGNEKSQQVISSLDKGYSITYTGSSVDNGTVVSGGASGYELGVDGQTVTLPKYTVSNNSKYHFQGWLLYRFADAVETTGLPKSVKTLTAQGTASSLFKAGETVLIHPNAAGDIEFKAVVIEKQGLNAVSEEKKIENLSGGSTIYHTYKLTTTVDGTAQNVGMAKFGDVSVAGQEGIYTYTSPSESMTVTVNGQTATLTKDDTAKEIGFESVRVLVKGYKPQSVTLGDGDPILTPVRGGSLTDGYLYQSAYRFGEDDKGNFPIYIDEKPIDASLGYTGSLTTSYCQDAPTVVQYNTLTVQVNTSGMSGSAITSLELRDEEGKSLFMQRDSVTDNSAVFKLTRLAESGRSYDIFVNGDDVGTKADFTADTTKEISYARYTTTVNTLLDGVNHDFGAVRLGGHKMIRTGKGRFTLTLLNNEAQSLYVDDIEVEQNVVPGNSKTVNYYTVTYAYSASSGTAEAGKLPEDSTIYRSGESAVLLGGEGLTNGGRTFDGWTIDGTRYAVGAQVTITSTTTVKAAWKQTEFDELSDSLKVELEDCWFVYNGESQTPGVLVTRDGKALTEDEDYTLTFSNTNSSNGKGADNAINAGTITVSVTGRGDYSGSIENAGSYEIQPKQLELKGLTAVDKVYDGTNTVNLVSSGITLDGVVSGDDVSVSAGSTGVLDNADAGNDRVITIGVDNLTGEAKSNYTLRPLDPVTVNITKKPLTESMFTVADQHYTAEAKTPDVTAVDKNGSGTNIIGVSDYTFEYEDNLHAGTASVVITAAEEGNYSGTVTKTFNIAKAPITVTAKSVTSEYGQTIPDISNEYTVSGTIYDGDSDALAIKAVTSVARGKAAGTYEGAVTISYNTENTDYAVTTVAAAHTVTVSATTAFTVAASGYVGVYDGQAHGITVDVSGYETSVSYPVYYSTGTVLTKDNYTSDGSTANPTFKDVTEQTVYFFVPDANSTSGGVSGSRTVKIVKAPLTVKLPDKTVAYGTTKGSIEGSIDATPRSLTVTGLADGDNAGGVLSGSLGYSVACGDEAAGTTIPKVGNYLINGCGLTATNYEITYAPGTLTVSPKPVTFTWTPVPGAGEGEKAFDYTGTMLGVTAAVASGAVVGSDEVTVGGYAEDEAAAVETTAENRSLRRAATKAGFYTAKVVSLAGKDAANYTIAESEATASYDWKISGGSGSTVSRTPLYVEWAHFSDTDGAGTEVTPDETPYDGSIKTVSIKRFYTKDGDTETEVTGLTPVFGGTWQAKDASATDSVYTATITGFISTDGTTTADSYELDNDAITSYYWKITGTTEAANNWTLAPKVESWNYGEAAPEPAAIAASGTSVIFKYRKSGDTDWTEWNDENTPSQAGSYELYAEAGAGNGYGSLNNGSSPASFTINKAEATLIADDKSSTYKGALAEGSCSLIVTKGRLTDEEKNSILSGVSYSFGDASSAADTGVYPIALAYTGNNADVDVTTVNGSYTIKPAELTVSFKDAQGNPVAEGSSFVYDGEAHGFASVSVSGADGTEAEGVDIRYSDSGALTTQTYGSAGKTLPTLTNAGTKTIYYYATAPNYMVATGSRTITVTKREITETLENVTVAYGSDDWASKWSAYNVGTHEDAVTKENTDDGNTVTSYTSAALTVTARELTGDMFALSVPAGGYTYDGTEKEPTVTATDEIGSVNRISADDYEVTYSENINAGADTATVTITAKDGGNYKNPESGSITKTFSIGKRAVTITASDATSVFNAPIADLSGTGAYTLAPADGIVPGDLEGLAIRVSTVVLQGDPVGEYAGAVTISYTRNPNYDITAVAGKYTVTSATDSLLVTASDYKGVYDGLEHGINVEVKTDRPNEEYVVYYSESVLRADNYASGTTSPLTYKDVVSDRTVYYYVVCDNYAPKAGSAKVTITRAPLTVQAPDAEMTYGDDIATILAGVSKAASAMTVTGLKGNDTAAAAINTDSVSYTTPAAPGTDAGKYALTFNGVPTSANYELTLKSGTLTVNKKPLTFTWSGLNGETGDPLGCTYDGESHGVKAALVGLTSSDTGKVSTIYSTEIKNGDTYEAEAETKNAGDYRTSAAGLTGEASHNYSIARNEPTAVCEWKINKASNVWTITPEFLSASGEGENITPVYKAAAKYGEAEVMSITYTPASDEPAAAAHYTLKLKVDETDNYTGLVSDELIYNVPDSPKTVVTSLPEGTEKLTVTYGDALPGDYQTGFTTDYIPGSVVGNYTIIKDADETHVYTPGVIEVVPKEVSLTWTDDTGFKYDGMIKTVTASVTSGLVAGDGISAVAYGENTNTAINAGSYTAVATAFDGVNVDCYTIVEASKTKVWSIAKAAGGDPGANSWIRDLAIQGWTYGDAQSDPYAEAKYGTVTYEYYKDAECANKTGDESGAAEEGGRPSYPGTYYVKAAVAESDDYAEISTGAVSFTIAKGELTVIAKDVSGRYGEAIKDFSDDDYRIIGNVVSGDDIGISLTTDATGSSTVGTYTISVNTNGTGAVNADKYDITAVNGKYFITGAELSLTLNKTGYSGVYDGQSHGISVSVDGGEAHGVQIFYSETELTAENYKSGSTMSPVYSEASEKTVYYYVVSRDYIPVSGSETVSITRKEVTVTANPVSITYGEDVRNEGVSYGDGFVGDDTAQTLNLTPTYTYSYTRYGDAGSYTVTPVLGDTTNYTFKAEAGSFTVEPKPLSFTWNTDSYVYDGTGKKVEPAITGLENGDIIGTALTGNRETAVGNYRAKITELTGEKAGNYDLAASTGTVHDWSITEGTNRFTVPLAINDWQYGDTPNEPAAKALYGTVRYEYSDRMHGTYTGTKPDQSGTWFVKAIVDATADYPMLESEPVSFSIQRIPLTIAANDIFAKVSEEALKELTYDTTGMLVSGESPKVRLSTTATGESLVGDYPITVRILDAEDNEIAAAGNGEIISGNYRITVINGTYHVTDTDYEVTVTGYNGVYDGQYHSINVAIDKPETSTAAPKVYYSTKDLSIAADKLASSTDVSESSPRKKDAGSLTVYYYIVDGSSVSKGSRTISIERAAVTVTAKDSKCSTKDEPAGNGVSYSGFVEGEDESVLNGTLSYTFTYKKGNPAGDYLITPGGLASVNYAISYVPGRLHVLKYLTFGNVEPDNSSYDGMPHRGFTGSVLDDEEGITEDELQYVYKKGDVILEGPPTEPGQYTVTISVPESNPDYMADPKTITFTIAAETLVITARDVVINVVDTELKNNGVVYTGFVEGDTRNSVFGNTAPTIKFYKDATDENSGSEISDLSGLSAGEYRFAVRPSGLSSSKYSIRYESGTLFVKDAGTPVISEDIRVTTVTATDITTAGAKLHAVASPKESVKDNSAGFAYRKSASTDEWTRVYAEASSIGDKGSFNVSISELSENTEYEYYAFATDRKSGASEKQGAVSSFKTASSDPSGEQGTNTINVTITSDLDVQTGVSVSIERGNELIAVRSGTTIVGSSIQLDPFTGLQDGYYNIVVRTLNGEFTETRMIDVSNSASAAVSFHIPQTSGTMSSIVKIEGGDTPQVAVSGLAELITTEDKKAVALGRKDVEVELDVEKKSEDNEDISGDAGEIKNVAKNIEGNIKIDTFLDITLFKTTTTLNELGEAQEKSKQNIGGDSSNPVLEIAVPFDTGKEGIVVFRKHGVNAASALNKLNSRPSAGNYADGEYFIDKVMKFIFIYSNKFSTYAIGYKDTEGGEEGGGGGTGGGGGGTTTYTPVITQPEHGTITVNPASPQSGQNAVVTVTPEEGYETENITVKDKDGNTVPVTKNDDGTYTFTQPETGPVTIEAVIKQAADLTPTIKKPEHGTISVNPAKPKAGEPAIITVTPDEGYEVDSVIVTDKEGKPVAFTLNADGTYSFIQPESGCVTIEAVLRLKDGVIVRFDLNGKTGTEPDPQTFVKGGKAVRPNDPAAEGYTFTGWYTDEKCKNAYDFDTPVNEDIILYAGWEKKAGPGPEDDDFGIYFAELFDDPYEGVHYNADYNDGEGRYEIVYTGAPIKPLIRVTSKADGVLKEGIDYSVSYSNNRNYSKKKPATIRVSGRGFYKSKKVLELYILQADLEKAYDKGLIAGADEFKVLNGSKLNPMIVYRGYKLAGRDRDISNKNKITGDTTTDITGKGNFTGALKDVPVKVISRDDQKKGAIKVNLKAGKHVYNGMPQELGVTTAEAVGELTVTAGSSKTPLEEGTDFVVSYSDNISVGRARVTITGIGACNGTIIKNFTIQPDKMSEINAALSKPDDPVYFNVRGAKPDITVTAHRKAADETVTDVVLTEGKDYKVSYSSNNRVGKGTYTVRFFNNYSGHKSVTGKYDIVPAPIDSARVEAVQMIYKKPGRYLSKPFVSIDGVQLKTSDYTYKYYLGDEEITSRYKLSLADGETSKTVKIVVTGKGNYTNSTAEGTYEVVRRTADAIDLSRAKIVAKDKVNGKDVKVGKQEYNGTPIEPEIRVLARVNKKWVEVDPSLYAVSYINNLNKGSATILVTGDGEEAIGSKTVKFSISTMRFELFRLIFGK